MFSIIVKMILNKVKKTIGLLRKFQNILRRSALLTIYKTFIRPHLDYSDIIYDKVYNASFHQKLELLQYNACLAITGAIRGTSKEKLYEELGLESLKLRRWHRKLSCFYKLFSSEHPHPSNYSLQEALVMFLEICIKILSLKQDILFLKTLSFRQLLLNGINLIIT